MLFGILPGSEARHWSIKLFGLGEVWASYWRIVSLVYPEWSACMALPKSWGACLTPNCAPACARGGVPEKLAQ